METVPSTSPEPPRTSGKAVLSLALGLGGILFCLVSPFAIYLGGKALEEINVSDGRLGGSASARTGIALGWIGSAFLAFVTWIALIYLQGWLSGEYPPK